MVGVVSESDPLAKLALGIDEDRMPGATGILAGEPHEEHRPFDVSVQSGVVTMFGMPLAAEQGYRMIRQARHVQGVVAVRDRLDYPLPRPSAYDALAGFPVD